tara:strand:- start:10268 stop:11185 length:918 start_codon:yes stop_codon:yes gene_type:complete
MRGIVIKSTGKNYLVKLENGVVFKSILKGKFRIAGIKSTNPIVVGDKVEISKVKEKWVITELYDRKNYILRKSVNLSKKTHIIAANVDQAILMITLSSPITSTGFIDRFLVAANAYDVDVFLIFNKIDILDNDSLKELKILKKYYQKIGYKCHKTSVLVDSISDIKQFFKGKVNMIAGHSGVGKSTLINRLQPNLNILTMPISVAHNQGQHTTTFSQLHELEFGGSIIDTPGIKGFGLVSIEKHDIGNYFKEFFNLKSKCKFHNCVHKDEPHCAVKTALKNGDILQSRYKNYLSMLNEDNDDLFR